MLTLHSTIKILLCLGCVLFSLNITPPVSANNGQYYINGIDANYPPFAFIDETGTPTGFDVEALNWIAKKLNFTIEHRPMEWDGIIPALLTKKIDMICSGMSISPEREKKVLFTTPYWVTQKVFVAQKDSTVSTDDIYYGKNILLGVQRGTNEAEILQQEKITNNYSYTLRFYDSAPLAIEDLINGRIAAVTMDSLPAEDAINHNKPIKILSVMNKYDAFGVALRKDDCNLAILIEEGYRLLQADPFWKTLQQKYLKEK